MAKGRDRRSKAGQHGSRDERAQREHRRREQARARHSRPPALEDQPLIRELRAALRDRPFTIVGLASSLLAAMDEGGPLDDAANPVRLDELVDSFVGVDVAETTAALHAIAAMTADEVQAARIRRAVASRRQPVPDVVAQLGAAAVTDAALMGHELDDGNNVILTVRWPDGFEVTPVLYIDHNLGTIVKDAFVVEEPSAGVLQAYRDLLDEGSGTLAPLDLADARAAITTAIENAGEDEPAEGAQWPACRPFVQMLLRSMPAGGRSDAGRPSYPQTTAEEVVADFLRSPEANAVVAAQQDGTRRATELLVSFAAEHSGHPLRWSGVSAELALTQYLPWQAGASVEAMDAVAAVLPALVTYSHRVLGISTESTTDTLASVRHWLDDFEELRALPAVAELRESTAALNALLAGDPGPWRRRLLLDELGSEAAIAALDVRPLPDEELDVSAVPADVHSRVREVVALTDAFADEMGAHGRFDYAQTAAGPMLLIGGDPEHGRQLAIELRTACRRFVARAAAGDPAIFRRKGRADTAAAAVVWAVGRANHLIGPSAAQLSSAEAHQWFGLGTGSSSQRAATMLRAIGVDPSRRYGQVVLASPDLLTSARRAALLRERDAYG